ncbi:MAG: rRNA maturation RNase YbeY [Coriobacteriia bacterium]|nr:rRNA maturation RNase YbeY [Coriobacteriia bacterium]
MSIQINNQSDYALEKDLLAEYVQLCEYLLLQQSAPPGAELSVTFVDETEMDALNKAYRGKQGATDVLAFPCDTAASDASDTDNKGDKLPTLLGDVVIAPQVALQQNSDVAAEIRLLLVHGVLHLLGYTHDDDQAAACMEAREHELLSDWAQLWQGNPHTCPQGGCRD